jgi:DNA-binding MarR family transcriptional regulator
MPKEQDVTEDARSPLCRGPRLNDLTFLLHTAVDRMTVELDRLAARLGLKDMRDWLVLAALDDGEKRTQLELSRMVCVDKTTLISVLDRLEQQGLVVRTISPTDRRVRIPEITPEGRTMHARFSAARDAAEAAALEDVAPAERSMLVDLLARICERQDAMLSERTT